MLLTLLVFYLFQTGNAPDLVVDSCSLASSPQTYHQKLIRVSGELYSDMHNLSLTFDCPGAVSIVLNLNPSSTKAQRERIDACIGSANHESRPQVVVVGRFETSVAIRNGKRRKIRTGFGRYKTALYRIVLEDIQSCAQPPPLGVLPNSSQ